MAPQVTSDDKTARSGDDKRAKEKICGIEETKKLLELVDLPNDLKPLGIPECWYVKDTGFVRMKWKVDQKFKAIGISVQYYTEISGSVEQQKRKKVNGLKSKGLREWITISIDDPASAKMKDLREWITISEISISGISINGPASAKICFKSDIGNNKSFSVGPSPTKESAIAGIKKGSE